MHVVERPVATAETGRAADRLGDIGARAAHRSERRHALGEADGDRRGEGCSRSRGCCASQCADSRSP